MSHESSDRDRSGVIRLSADRRYDYFVRRVAQDKQIWSLRSDEGWVVFSTEDQDECMPVWPDAAFAADWATEDWADCSPAAVPLDTWLERWTPGMTQDGSMIAVFPGEDEEGVVVNPAELRESIEAELDQESQS